MAYRENRSSVPMLHPTASPSPAKARVNRLSTEKPALAAASAPGPLVLPTELFKIATSRNSQVDAALTKALDDIQLAVRGPFVRKGSVMAYCSRRG